MRLKTLYAELQQYFMNARFEGFGWRVLQIAFAFVFGAILASIEFGTNIVSLLIETGLHGAVIAVILNSFLALWLAKGTPSPSLKSGIYWIIVILLGMGWSILFSFGLQGAHEITFSTGLLSWSVLFYCFWFLLFIHSKIEAIVFQNLQNFWNESQTWGIAKAVNVKGFTGILLGIIIILFLLSIQGSNRM